MSIGFLEGWPLEKTGRFTAALGASDASREGIGSVDPPQVTTLQEQVSITRVTR